MAQKQALDIRDSYGTDLDRYLSEYGWHFTKKLCNYAVSMMKGIDGQRITPLTQDQVNELLKKYNVTISNNTMHDYVFVANMCKAKCYKRSIPDEQHLAMFIKDYIDDPNEPDGVAMRSWYAAMVGKGEPIDWDEVYEQD